MNIIGLALLGVFVFIGTVASAVITTGIRICFLAEELGYGQKCCLVLIFLVGAYFCSKAASPIHFDGTRKDAE